MGVRAESVTGTELAENETLQTLRDYLWIPREPTTIRKLESVTMFSECIGDDALIERNAGNCCQQGDALLEESIGDLATIEKKRAAPGSRTTYSDV